MEIIYSILAALLLRAVAAVPDAPAPYPVVRRQEDHTLATATGANATATATGTTSYYEGTLTAGGGVYAVTSLSGVAIVAGHTLSPGDGNAVVGGDFITAATSGLVHDGSVVAVTPVTSSPSSTTIETTVTSDSTTLTKTTAVSVTAKTTTSVGGSLMTGNPVVGAFVGGLVGMLLL